MTQRETAANESEVMDVAAHRGREMVALPHPGTSVASSTAHFYIRAATIVALVAFNFTDLVPGGKSRFLWNTCLLVSFVAVEVAWVRRREPRTWLLRPVVLASVFTIALGFCISNASYVDSGSLAVARMYAALGASAYAWMNRAMMFAVVAAMAMWVGYSVPLGRQLARVLWHGLHLSRWMRLGWELRWTTVALCLGVSVSARLVQISLGIFGYSSQISSLYAASTYSAYLSVGADLSRLALAAIALSYYGIGDRDPRTRTILVVVFLYELILGGFLTGFKGQVVAPFAIIGAAYYITARRVSYPMVAGALMALAIGYVVIEPFRRARFLDPNFESSNIAYIASTMMAQADSVDAGTAPNMLMDQYLPQLQGSTSMVLETAKAIQYADQVGLSRNSPRFLRDLLMSPAYAVVPRFMWPDKPLQNLGNWYANEVWGENTTTNARAMGPLGYLYFAGGGGVIFLGFLAIGILQRCADTMFGDFRVAGGMIVYLGLLSPLVLIDSAFYTIFVTILRTFPFLILAQWALFRR